MPRTGAESSKVVLTWNIQLCISDDCKCTDDSKLLENPVSINYPSNSPGSRKGSVKPSDGPNNPIAPGLWGICSKGAKYLKQMHLAKAGIRIGMLQLPVSLRNLRRMSQQLLQLKTDFLLFIKTLPPLGGAFFPSAKRFFMFRGLIVGMFQ